VTIDESYLERQKITVTKPQLMCIANILSEPDILRATMCYAPQYMEDKYLCRARGFQFRTLSELEQKLIINIEELYAEAWLIDKLILKYLSKETIYYELCSIREAQLNRMRRVLPALNVLWIDDMSDPKSLSFIK